MTDQDTQDTQAPEAAPATVPSLTLSDLALALNTIQAVSQRGAIRAEEMEVVGGLYNRLFKFLEAQGVIQPTAPQASADAPAAE